MSILLCIFFYSSNELPHLTLKTKIKLNQTGLINLINILLHINHTFFISISINLYNEKSSNNIGKHRIQNIKKASVRKRLILIIFFAI